MLRALRDFALSQRGPDEMRLRGVRGRSATGRPGAYVGAGHRRTLQISEFENLCISYIQLGLAKKDRFLVEGWLDTWKTVDADSETYRIWQARVKFDLFRLSR